LFDEALQGRVSDEALLRALPAAANHVGAARLEAMAAHLESRFQSDLASQFAAMKSIAAGSIHQGQPLSESLGEKLSALMESAISGKVELQWYNVPLDSASSASSPWVRQLRSSQDGTAIDMISSLSKYGERAGGRLRSPAFTIPERMTFWMSGHNGFPSEPDRKLNFVRLILEDGVEVARSYPPRSD